jgi:hypothetical protein
MAMKVLSLICLVALAACESPMLTAEMAIGNNGVSVRPALSAEVGTPTSVLKQIDREDPMRRLILLACMTLAGCGADGPPQAPAPTGLSVSGEAQIGIVSK